MGRPAGLTAAADRGAGMAQRPKQQNKRLRRRIEIHFGEREPRHPGFSGNISPAGIMVRTTRVYPPGTVLALELKFPEATFRLKAVVMWARQGDVQWLQTGRVGMGLRFVDPPPEMVEFLRARAASAA
jgi:uncharacterized protein (TIGR02266 family)